MLSVHGTIVGVLVVTLGDALLDVIVRLGEPLTSGADALATTETAAGGQAGERPRRTRLGGSLFG